MDIGHYAGAFIHNDDTTGSHDRSHRCNLFIIHRGIQQVFRNTAPRWSSQMNRLKLAFFGNTTANIIMGGFILIGSLTIGMEKVCRKPNSLWFIAHELILSLIDKVKPYQIMCKDL